MFDALTVQVNAVQRWMRPSTSVPYSRTVRFLRLPQCPSTYNAADCDVWREIKVREQLDALSLRPSGDPTRLPPELQVPGPTVQGLTPPVLPPWPTWMPVP